MADTDLLVGDLIEERHGPFVASWEVAEIIDAGARLTYVEGTVRFDGYKTALTAHSGAQLTTNPEQGFLGRAHWPSTPRRRWNPMKQAFE